MYFPEPKKVDFYYLLNDVSKNKIRDSYNLINETEYRSFVTFSDQIQHFQELGNICTMIALVNYPPKRFTKHYFRQEITKTLQKRVDEIEFPWRDTYLTFGKAFWREMVLLCIESGVRLRPMLDIAIDNENYIENCIVFFKEIGLYTIMTSTGLVESVTTIEIWGKYKYQFPNIFEVKIGGIDSLLTAAKFIKEGVELIATTDILKR